MRYVWDHSHEYQNDFKSFRWLRPFYKPILHRIRLWDRIAAERPDLYIANSQYIAERVRKYYDRESTVIHPPVDLSLFHPKEKEGDYYLAVGRLIPYKRFDLVVEACARLDKPLKVVGVGPQLKRLKKMAGPEAEFLGAVSDSDLRSHYQGAKALLFPQLEDFGIVPLEAMACGTPVLAFGAGGALETVREGIAGLFFKEQSVESLVHCIRRFEKSSWSPETVAETASEFSNARFKSELRHFLESAWKEHQNRLS